MKRVLITGAAGFIGSHLCEKFLRENYYVIGVDNFITGQRLNISHLFCDPNFQFIEQDVTILLDYPKKLDYILHFACPASPVDYLNFPIETMKVDSIGTFNALELALKNNAVFLFASTSEIYGDPHIHPQIEDYWGNVNPIGIRSVYDEAKRFSEALSMAYFRKHKLNIRIIRIFNTYGTRMRQNDGRVVPNFIGQALNNQNITIYGDGTQTRSFCYVADMIEGIFKTTIQADIDGEIFNLGNPDEYKILDFAQVITELIKTKSKIIFRDLPLDDPKQRRPDISKAMRILGWKPKVLLREGLTKTIEYFSNLPQKLPNPKYFLD